MNTEVKMPEPDIWTKHGTAISMPNDRSLEPMAMPWHSPNQLRAYGDARAAEERERCAVQVERMKLIGAYQVAEAIRKGVKQ